MYTCVYVRAAVRLFSRTVPLYAHEHYYYTSTTTRLQNNKKMEGEKEEMEMKNKIENEWCWKTSSRRRQFDRLPGHVR